MSALSFMPFHLSLSLISIGCSIAATFPLSAAVPQISPGGVVNAASFAAAPNNAIAPGALISIFGTNLAPSQGSATQLPLKTVINNTQVLINGTPIPLVFVAPGQINAQVPFDIAAGSSASVVVNSTGGHSAPVLVAVQPVAPGIFTQSGTGTATADVLHADFTLVTELSPALPGEVVLIYATGLGATLPAGTTGAASNGEPTIETPSVMIGDQTAQVLFSGAAPGFVGLYQINAMIPASLKPGDAALSIRMQSSGLESPSGVTLPFALTIPVNVSLSTTPATVVLGDTVPFTATVTGTSNTAITWDVNGVTGGNAATGTISAQGLYTAPTTLPANPTVTITATSVADSTRSASTSIIVVSGPVPSIAPTYMGLHISPGYYLGNLEWPKIRFGAIRMLGDNVQWADVNPSPGVFNFSRIDNIITTAVAEGQSDFIYTLFRTPMWASSTPNDNCFDYAGRTGGCEPPDDLNADGSGTNQHWIDYVTAVAQHEAGEGIGKIKNWEIWNEPNSKNMWTGTNAQLIRMARDAYHIVKSVDPDARILSPPPGDGGDVLGANWLSSYLSSGGAQWADIIAFHGYLRAAESMLAENINGGLAVISKSRTSNPGMKPIWNTEGSWGLPPNLPDSDLQAAFVGRYYLLQAAIVDRVYWYAYDYPNGMLYNANSLQLTKAGTAYGQVYNWLVGAALISPCSTTGTVWTCQLTRSGGYRALAVWDASQTCSNGACSTSTFAVPPQYVTMRDLAGRSSSLQSGQSIGIGAKPILLENLQ